MTFEELIKKLQKYFDTYEEVGRFDLDTCLDIIYNEAQYCFRRNDIVKITVKYPKRICEYIGIIGGFTYGETDTGFGPTEAIHLKLTTIINPNKEIEVLTSVTVCGPTTYASKEEIIEFLKVIAEHDCIL